MVDFSDMDDLDTAEVRPDRLANAPQPANTAPAQMKCPKCKGSGQTQWGGCYTCHGKGVVAHGYDKRRAAYQKGQETQRRNAPAKASANWTTFAGDGPANAARAQWLHAAAERGFNFAANLKAAVERFGSLTSAQQAAVDKLMAEDAQRGEQRAERTVELGGANAIREAMLRAVSNGLKKPKLRCGAVRFDWPREGSKNPGCIYVVGTEDDAYLGKILPSGAFEPSYRCTEPQRQTVLRIGIDPLAAAVEHGRETGKCACCGRPLSDPESVARGIGPICASNFFGA